MGQVLRGKWHLQELLGVGGGAAVYRAAHRNGRRVAVKVLHCELATSSGARARFLREGYVANLVGHPGVACILDDDVAEDGAAFLVMELLEGETVDERCRRKGATLSEGEVLSIADQLLDVLSAAHDRGIVHRDIKPANLFLTREGVVKLLDFGVARSAGGASEITMHGSAMGTPAFMPPEQAHGRRDQVGRRTDLWAVGATMLTLLSGRHVHLAGNVHEAMLAAMTRPAPCSRAIVPSLAPEIADVIDRALRFDVGERWADARSMQRAVRNAYQAWLFRRISTGPPPRKAPFHAMQIAAAALLLAIPVLLAVVVSLTWIKVHRAPQPQADALCLETPQP